MVKTVLKKYSLDIDIFIHSSLFPFTAGHRISVVKSEKKVILDAEPKSQSKKEAWERQENDMKKEETVAESGRIFIRNLAYSATEEDLEALFSRYGPLAETHLPIDKHSRKIKVRILFFYYIFKDIFNVYINHIILYDIICYRALLL